MTEDSTTQSRGAPEHIALSEALASMETALAGLEAGERGAVGHAVRSCEDAIKAHCEAATAPDGLLAEVERAAGRNHHVTEAHAAHEQLLEQLRGLASLAASEGDLQVIRQEGRRAADALRKHLALEADLVYDTVLGQETGAGD